MSKNKLVIDQINNYAQGIIDEISKRDVRQFSIPNIEIEGEDASYDGKMLSRGAMKSLMNTLKVKDGFTKLGESTDRAKWSQTLKTIQGTLSEQKMFALFGKDLNGDDFIQQVYPTNPKLESVSHIEHQQVIDCITKGLETTDKEYSLSSIEFSEQDNAFDIILLENRLLDMGTLLSGGKDDWKPGCKFRFSEMEFEHNPFFMRMICDNGAMTKQYGFGSKVYQKKHNITKISRLIEHNLVSLDDKVSDLVKGSIGYVKAYDASINEVLSARAAVKKALKSSPEAYETVKSKYFDDSHWYNGYGVDIEEQPDTWKSTASSGTNGYELFNLMTWLASHPNESGLADDQQKKIVRVAASNFLFKLPLDMAGVAPSVKLVPYKIPEMQ